MVVVVVFDFPFFFACLGSLLGFWGVKLVQDRGG